MSINYSTESASDRVNRLLHLKDNEVSAWRIFKIMSEFVYGFEFLSQFDKSVTFFGTARCELNDSVYQEATKLAKMIASEGIAIVTGGGPGIMEAANKGAVEGGGESIGINIQLPKEQRINEYVRKSAAFSYFFTRKVILSFSSEAYIFFPGGFGTLDEFFEIITLIQTGKIDSVPVVLVGVEYWSPLLDFIEKVVYEKSKAIDKNDMDIYSLVDSAEEAFAILKDKI